MITSQGEFAVKILERMLEVETEARQIVEQAKAEANTIRKKARDDAKQLIINGKKELQERIEQEIRQIEADAIEHKTRMLKEADIHLNTVTQRARKHLDPAAEHVLNALLAHDVPGDCGIFTVHVKDFR